MSAVSQASLADPHAPHTSQVQREAKKSSGHQSAKARPTEYSDPRKVRVEITRHMREDNSVSLSFGKGGEDAQLHTLDPTVTAAVLELLRVLAIGDGYAIVPADYEVTSEQAAKHLRVQHDCMLKILEEGKIRCCTKDGQLSVRADDLFAYDRRQMAITDKGLTDLVRLDEEIGRL